MSGGTVETFIDGSMNELTRPSGLALVGDRFYVTDATTSRITAASGWRDLKSICISVLLGWSVHDSQHPQTGTAAFS